MQTTSLVVALTIFLLFKNDFQCDAQQQQQHRLNHLQREQMMNNKLNGNAPFPMQNFLGCDCTNQQCDPLSLAQPPSGNKCTFICCFEMNNRERRLNDQHVQRGMRDRGYPLARGPLDHDLEPR